MNPSGPSPVLTSLWDGLSPHLIASFWPVERAASGSRAWKKIEGAPVVKAALTESNIEFVLGWKSPFEDAGTEKSLPTVSAMLQSGAIQPWLSANDRAMATMEKFEGRTGITKLNATQVFAGMPPLKITVTALFRAWRDTADEVMAPVNQLIQWALPQDLAIDGPILSLLKATKQVIEGKPLDDAAATAALPSVAPTKIAMKYKGMLYSPLVIESIGYPIGSPVDKNGRYVNLHIPMTLCSLSAIDRKDWERAADGSYVAGGFLT